jgi:hypothetical protein
LQQGLGSVESLVCSSGIGMIDGLLSLVQRRFNP